MHTSLQIPPATLFEKIPLQQTIDENAIADLDSKRINQPNLFPSQPDTFG